MAPGANCANTHIDRALIILFYGIFLILLVKQVKIADSVSHSENYHPNPDITAHEWLCNLNKHYTLLYWWQQRKVYAIYMCQWVSKQIFLLILEETGGKQWVCSSRTMLTEGL